MNALKFLKNFIENNSEQSAINVVKNAITNAPKGATRYSYSAQKYYKQSKLIWIWTGLGWRKISNDMAGFQDSIILVELENLAESLEIINELEGLEQSKSALKELNELGWNSFEHRWIDNWTCTKERLEQAITDYEDVYVNDVKHQIQYGIPVMSNSKAGCVYFPYTSMTMGIDLADGPDWSASIKGDNS